jgi:glutathione synthase/RimK-type ligase-like ATP-grasp enzyme
MSFRETLYKERDGAATGTGVFVGAKFNGFPEDSYKDDNISSPISYRNSFLLDNRWSNLLRAGKEEVDLEDTVEINGYSIGEINDELEAEGNGEMTLINTKFFNKEWVDIGRDYDLTPRESWQKLMDEGVNAINPPSIADACNSKAQTYDIFESSGVTSPPWFNLHHYVEGDGLEELESDVNEFKDRYNFSNGPEGDIPVVLKPYNGSGGTGIETTTMNSFLNTAENYSSLERYLGEKSDNDKFTSSSWLLQFAVPAAFDQRVITGDGEIHTSSIRKGDGIIHNMDNGASAVGVEREEISDGVRHLVEEAEEALVESIEPHENAHRFLGWDVLGFNPYDELMDDFPQYQDFIFDHLVTDQNFIGEFNGEEIYGVPGEINDTPGYKIDGVNSDFPYQNSCLALTKLAEDISRDTEHTRVGKDQLHPKIRKEIQENDFTLPPGSGQEDL